MKTKYTKEINTSIHTTYEDETWSKIDLESFSYGTLTLSMSNEENIIVTASLALEEAEKLALDLLEMVEIYRKTENENTEEAK